MSEVIGYCIRCDKELTSPKAVKILLSHVRERNDNKEIRYKIFHLCRGCSNKLKEREMKK